MAGFFIKRPIFAIVLAIMITLLGLIAAFQLPVAQYPQITPPQITARASYPAANADVIEKTIAQAIEQQVNGVENMVSMQSASSDDGTYSLNVKFELGKDPDLASVQTQNRVAQANASLPEEVQRAGITTSKINPDTSFIFALWSPQGTYDDIFLKNYGSVNIVEKIKRIKGVGNVREFGADFGMRIWLKPDKMAQLGVTVKDVYDAVTEQNAQASAGTIGQLPSSLGQEFQYTAKIKGALSTPEEFSKIIIKADENGGALHVGDVAKVELGGNNYSYKNSVNGQPAAGFAIQLTSDANAMEAISRIKQVIAEASKQFPPDMDYKIIVDNTDFVKASLREVLITFIEALIMVVLVVFLFLQSWRATLIPILAIPVSLLGTLGSFLILGFSINVLTLFAMVLAIGLVVDDAIVVIESVEYHMRSGFTVRAATVQAMKEVSGPVVAIAFVLTSVFVPVAFFGGTVGVLYKQFALTIAVSMGLSALTALSLTPALCALLMKPRPIGKHTWLQRKLDVFNRFYTHISLQYEKLLPCFIKRYKITLGMLVLLIVSTIGLSYLVPASFVPAEDQGYFMTALTLPEAASLNRTQVASNKIVVEMRKQPGVQDVIAIMGLDMLTSTNRPNAAAIFTGLKPWDERTKPELQIDQEMRKIIAVSSHLPEASVLPFNAPALPGIGSRGGFTLMVEDRGGNSDEELDRVSKELVAVARKRPEIGMIFSNFRIDTPGYEFEVDREKAKKQGVLVSDVYNALQTYYGGLPINDFNRFGRTYKVIMQAEARERSDVNDARFFFVRNSSGQLVPLDTLIKSKPINGPAVIQRFNGYRSIQISGNPAPGYSSGQVLAALEDIAVRTLPSSFSYEWADQSREEKISSGRTPILFGLALAFVFLCLAALYESWSIPIVVILSIPVGVFGAFLFQYMSHLQNNIYMQIGLVVLIGLVAKNAILIVEFAKKRTDENMEPIQAVIKAATLRLRPILMTSLAFIMGCIPLALATGAGAAARNSMGTAVVGGMMTATLLGVFIIPVLFVTVVRITRRFSVYMKANDVHNVCLSNQEGDVRSFGRDTE